MFDKTSSSTGFFLFLHGTTFPVDLVVAEGFAEDFAEDFAEGFAEGLVAGLVKGCKCIPMQKKIVPGYVLDRRAKRTFCVIEF